MKVILTPQGGPHSPYIAQLVSSLREASIQVNLAQDHPFVLWRAVLDYGRPHVIHIQWQHSHFKASNMLRAVWRALQFFFQIVTLRLWGVRFVWTVHNLVNHEKIHSAWELHMRRLLARSVDAIIVHCQAAIPVVASTYRISPERLHVVPHGHFIDLYSSLPPQAVARGELNLPADELIFLFFGQVRAYKGIDRLLDSFTALKNKKARLVIAGEPKPSALGDALLAQVQSNPKVVTCFDHIPDEKVTLYLSACDLVVLPYRDSLTSGVAVLAMSYGRPVLGPQLGCMKELSSDVAILYDPQQSDGLQSALEQALLASLGEMGQAAKAYCTQFPWSLTAAKTTAIYRSAMSQKQDVSLLHPSQHKAID
jgi:glycosyltransferase involved in cell wall biosynthesis